MGRSEETTRPETEETPRTKAREKESQKERRKGKEETEDGRTEDQREQKSQRTDRSGVTQKPEWQVNGREGGTEAEESAGATEIRSSGNGRRRKTE